MGITNDLFPGYHIARVGNVGKEKSEAREEKQREDSREGKTGEAWRQKLGEKGMGMRIRCSKVNDTEGTGWGMETEGRGRSDGGGPRTPRRSRGQKAEGRGDTEEQGADWQKRVTLEGGGARGEIPSRGAATSAGSRRTQAAGRDESRRLAGPGPTPCAQRMSGTGQTGERPQSWKELAKVRRSICPGPPPGRGLVLDARGRSPPAPSPARTASSPRALLRAVKGRPVRDDPRCRR